MVKRNALIAIIIVVSLICVVPSIVTRISYESSHKAFEVALSLSSDMTQSELEVFRKNGITTLLADEKDSEFDKKQISLAKNLGFDIALRINVGEKPADGFEDRLDAIVRENDVKYLLISENKDIKSYDAPLEKVIEKNNMTVVVCENMKQLSNEMPKGYDRYLKASDGRLIRAYTTLKNPAGGLNSTTSSEKVGELLYHHMSNSLVDRNTEFMVISLIENSSVSRDKAIEETITAANKFKKQAIRLGYVEGKDVSLEGYVTDVRLPSAASVMLLCIMAMASIEILLKKRIKRLEWLFSALAVVSFIAVYFLPERLVFLVPTAFAPLSAMFSFTISMATLAYTKHKKLPFFPSLLIVFATSLVSLFLGAVYLGSMLSGTDYYLNNLIFRGVKLSLVLPIMYAFVFMWIFENHKLNLKLENIRKAFAKIKFSHIIIIAIAILAVIVYVTRSGNAKISPFENAFRNLLSDISGIRPRTKEIAIGWPLLALSVYLIHRKAPKLLTWLLCSASSVLFASVTNTFCHVFADFSVSAVRSLNGLMISIPIIVLVLLAAKIFNHKKI